MGSSTLASSGGEGEIQGGGKARSRVSHSTEGLLATRLRELKEKSSMHLNRQFYEKLLIFRWNWVAGLLEDEQFLQQMWGKMGLIQGKETGETASHQGCWWGKGRRNGWNMNHAESWTMSPDSIMGNLTPERLWGTEKSDLWVEWEKEKRMLAFDIKEGVQTSFLPAFNSTVPWKLRIRHVFQLLTPADLSVPSRLETRSLEHCKYLCTL